MQLPSALRDADYCYITTAGRVTGSPHTVEIWFAVEAATLYVLAGGRDRADFVRNVRKTPRVTVRIGDRAFAGTARIVGDGTDEDALARRLLLAKYRPRYSGDLDDWGRDALPVAFDLDVTPAAR